MAKIQRTATLKKILIAINRHYRPVPLRSDCSLLEYLLFACCLEKSSHHAAETVYDTLATHFFDWNEVRVSSIRELVEVMSPLHDAPAAAHRIKSVLQSVFESLYTFDLEELRKQGLGQAVKQLEKFEGTNSFNVSYVAQLGLGGHYIPVNEGVLKSMFIVGAIDESEIQKNIAPGLTRAIPKAKGVEYTALLHQWGLDFLNKPYAPATRKVLLEIAPDCHSRLPKRPTKKSVTGTVRAKKAKEKVTTKKKVSAKKKAPSKKKTPSAKKAATKKKAPSTKKSSIKKKAPAVKKKVPSVKKIARKKKTSTKKKSGKKTRPVRSHVRNIGRKKNSLVSTVSKRKPG